MDYIIYILVLWNLIVFAIYGIDKQKAKKKEWRISERTLLLSAFLMGSVGALIGIGFFRHKTKSLKFRILIPFAILFNLVIIIGIYSGFRVGIYF